MSEITIGILAGMGARATAPFLDLVVDQCQVQYDAKYDAEYPHIMIYSLPTPLYLDRPLDHEALSSAIVAGLRRLEGCGVDFIAMPCNTAHQYYDQLQRSIGVPLLNIVEETLARLPESARAVALFATEFTVDAGLYQRGFERDGRTFVHEQGWQAQVNAVLDGIKDNEALDALKARWEALLEAVGRAGVDLAVLGCTDLNAVSRHCPPSLPLADATEMLAQATVQHYLARSEVVA